MPITKALGQTPTEQLLSDLCDRSFMKLWSYANPYKDDGKELCDVIAVFDNHVFIFFDRESRRFDKSKAELWTTWQRWKTDVIDRQVRTAHGAARYIRSGRPIYLDDKGTVPFPIEFLRTNCIVHKIVVAHGAAEACKAFSDANIYGSLGICYGDKRDSLEFPFVVQLERNDPVHLLDSHNLPIVLKELDTFHDFASYLCAKEAYIRNHLGLSYCGEEDLLAAYLMNYDHAARVNVIGPKGTTVDFLTVSEGEWQALTQMEEYKNKKQADEISYLWDDLIQRTCENALAGTLLGEKDIFNRNSALHVMAREPRLSRRALARNIARVVREFPGRPDEISRHVSLMPSYYEETGYVFIQLHVPNALKGSEDQYRQRKRTVLEVACGAAKNRFSHLSTIVGLAIDAPKFTDYNSEDFLLMNCKEWTEEQRNHYERANAGFGFFQSGRIEARRLAVQQFPAQARAGRRRSEVGRNMPCPCGSGRKYKKCCGSLSRIAFGG